MIANKSCANRQLAHQLDIPQQNLPIWCVRHHHPHLSMYYRLQLLVKAPGRRLPPQGFQKLTGMVCAKSLGCQGLCNSATYISSI